MKYEIIIEANVYDLSVCVQEKLDEGWEPVGGPFQVPNSNGDSPSYGQAVIKRPGKAPWRS